MVLLLVKYYFMKYGSVPNVAYFYKALIHRKIVSLREKEKEAGKYDREEERVLKRIKMSFFCSRVPYVA